MPVGKKSLERAEGTVKTGEAKKPPVKRTVKKAKPADGGTVAAVTADALVPAEKTWQVISHIACDLPDYLL